jgi:hypothetical protein
VLGGKVMSHQIYRNRQFKIYETLEGYIVHNSDKPFDYGHTHIKRFDTAKYLIYLSIHKIVPKKLPNYLMVSLIRLSNDFEYTNKISFKLQEGGFNMACGGKKSSTTKKSCSSKGKKKKSGCKKSPK